MKDKTRPDALDLFREEHDTLRALLESARDAARDTPPPEGDLPLHTALAELQWRVPRYCKVECEVLQAPLAALEPPVEAAAEAKTRCEVANQLLDRVSLLAQPDADGDEQGDFRKAFDALADHLLLHIEASASTLFPLAREHGLDLVALAARIREMVRRPEDEEPAATRAEDGRLDIGTAEDRNPTLE